MFNLFKSSKKKEPIRASIAQLVHYAFSDPKSWLVNVCGGVQNLVVFKRKSFVIEVSFGISDIVLYVRDGEFFKEECSLNLEEQKALLVAFRSVYLFDLKEKSDKESDLIEKAIEQLRGDKNDSGI